MTDPSKIDAVRSYLQATFPQHELKDKSRGANGHDFNLSRGGSAYKVTVKRSFLDDHTPEEIDDLLRRWQMERTLKKSETAGVIVGNGGLCVDWPDAPPS
jgi:hypothetical protein